MAKSKVSSTLQHPSKPKTSLFLCCFGSSSHALDSSPTKDVHILDMKMKKKKKRKKKSAFTSWFSCLRIRFNKKSSHKTVPFESSIASHHHAHDSKTKSKSTLPHKAQPPATTTPPPPAQPASVLPATPFYTPTQTRHGMKHNAEDTRQQGRGSPAQAKLQERRPPSTAAKTTFKKGRNNGVVGMSVVAVTLVIMIFCGRLCAILCTSVWLYCAPHFRKTGGVNDDGNPKTTPSNDVDLDSEEYKKKVIMKGLLGRNHRAVL